VHIKTIACSEDHLSYFLHLSIDEVHVVAGEQAGSGDKTRWEIVRYHPANVPDELLERITILNEETDAEVWDRVCLNAYSWIIRLWKEERAARARVEKFSKLMNRAIDLNEGISRMMELPGVSDSVSPQQLESLRSAVHKLEAIADLIDEATD